MYWVKVDLHNLYFLKIGDPMKVVQQVDYRLEGDGYQCNRKGYEVCSIESGKDSGKCARIFNKEIMLVVPAALIFGPSDHRNHICQVLYWHHNHICQVLYWEEDEVVG